MPPPARDQSKKANGLGSIRETATKKYRWEVMVDGHRFSGTVKTKREAQQAISTKIAEGARGGIVDPNNITVADYLAQWLEGRKATRAVRTHQIQADILARHIQHSSIGGRKLQKLTPAELRRFFDTLNVEREINGKRHAPLGKSTQRLIHQFLHQGFRAALEIELILRNITEFVKPTPPRDLGEDDEVDAYTPEEDAAFLQACRVDHRGKLFEFALSTGLRPGELCGLTWANVDWEKRTVSIQETVIRAGNKPLTSTPKTRGSRRTVHLSPAAMTLLREQQQEQDTARHAMREKWMESGRIFTTMNGRTLHPANLRKDMMRIYSAAGVRHLKVHGLRHTYASLSLMRGVPLEVVSKQLGHASPAFTLNVYRTVYKAERAQWAMSADDLTAV